MFGFGAQEILIVLVVGLLVFGPTTLPKIGVVMRRCSERQMASPAWHVAMVLLMLTTTVLQWSLLSLIAILNLAVQ